MIGMFDVASDDATEIPAKDRTEAEPSIVSLILRANSAVRPTIVAARKMERLSLMEARLMRRLYMHPGSKATDLCGELLLGLAATEDLVRDLCRRGLLYGADAGALHLSQSGIARFEAVLAHARELEDADLAGIPEQDIAAAKRVLSTLIERHERPDSIRS